MVDLRPYLDGAAQALRPAFRAFVLTALAMSFAAVVVAAACYAVASGGGALRGAIAAIIAIALFAVLGFTLSWKRALGAGVLQIVRARRLAGGLVAAVFERLLGVGQEGEPGARGARLAQAVERVPLNEAARRLRLAVIHQVRAAPAGGGARGVLRRAIEARLLAAVERLTLARFRDETEGKGGVDLVKVRDELSAAADTLIAEHIEGALLRVTLLLSAVAVIVSLGAALGLQRMP